MYFKGEFNVQFVQKRIKCAGFVFVELELGFQLLPCAHFVQFFFFFCAMFEDFRDYLVLIPSAKWISFSIVTHWHGFLKLSLCTVQTAYSHRRIINSVRRTRLRLRFARKEPISISSSKLGQRSIARNLIWFDLKHHHCTTEDANM